MSSPPHPLMHFGMTGWFHIRNMETAYYKPNASKTSTEWPPKYWKFNLETAEEPKCEAAFVDCRRFARIRLVDCPAEDIRNMSPLKENGPDPVVDKEILTERWLVEKLGSKHIPVKALMLDQANISGIGNWVGDEILYDAKIHPEQYSNTLSAAQIAQLHRSIHYVCGFAVENLADSSKFPEEWLFKYRWGKGKKDSTTTLPNGSKFVFMTVGGRTSCVVPSVQKKTGPVAGDVKVKPEAKVFGEAGESKGKKGGREAVKAEKEDEEEEDENLAAKSKHDSEKRASKVKEEGEEVPVNGEDKEDTTAKPASKKRKSNAKAETNRESKKAKTEEMVSGRRRSGRVSGKDI